MGTILLVLFVFFFQAEDGIRDIGVTGVQTCALPIYAPAASVATSRAVSAFGARAQEPNGYFPLQIGNRWHSISETRAGRIPPDGGPVDELAYFTDIFRFLEGTETIDGTSYVVEQDSTNQQGSSFGPVVNWIRYRQDLSGLY